MNNNKKKKITTVVLLLAFLAIAVTGGTLAYFTDTKDATNTFVMGNVKIDLVEEFDEANALLIPGHANKINKDVTIKNVGTNDAYVWYEYLIPVALDNRTTPENKVLLIENLNPDKWNYNATVGTHIVDGYIGTESVDSVDYNKYIAIYKEKISYNNSTVQGMDAVYLNSKVDYDTTTKKYTINSNVINHDFSKNVKIIVRAYAIQADGLSNVDGNGTTDVYDAYLLYKQQNV